MQVKRPGAGDQSHHAGPFASGFADLSDAPQSPNIDHGRCSDASAGAAGPLHKSGMASFSSAGGFPLLHPSKWFCVSFPSLGMIFATETLVQNRDIVTFYFVTNFL